MQKIQSLHNTICRRYLGRCMMLSKMTKETTTSVNTAAITTTTTQQQQQKRYYSQQPSSLLLSSSSSLSSSFCNTNTNTNNNNITKVIKRYHGGPTLVGEDVETISIIFQLPDGKTKETVTARVGESLLQTAHNNDNIDLEGACEGVCACSTCHLILSESLYDTLDEPSEEEEDMLDMAFGLTTTSRLGCQIIVTKEMENIIIEMPQATRNFYVDGHVPKPH